MYGNIDKLLQIFPLYLIFKKFSHFYYDTIAIFFI